MSLESVIQSEVSQKEKNKYCILTHTHGTQELPHGSVGKESTCNAGDNNLTSGSGRSPGEGNGNPLQYPCLENPMDRGAWGGYSSWGCKESDMPEMTEHTYMSGIQKNGTDEHVFRQQWRQREQTCEHGAGEEKMG